MFDNFRQKGKISFILGGQFGSEGKGAAAAFMAKTLTKRNEFFAVVTTNAGVQSGHTSIHNGLKRVLFHLPTAGVMQQVEGGTSIYLNAGSVIDPRVLYQEIEENNIDLRKLVIHPNAAIVTPACREAEMHADSAQTKIASTRKGVGEAISRKVLRSGMIARDYPWHANSNVAAINLNGWLRVGHSVLAEVPQGVGLSLNSEFYPHCTSRDCTVMQAMSDAGVHPSFYGQTMLVLRTYPIRVGNIEVERYEGGKPWKEAIGKSGGHYPDQQETSWEALGVQAEITTVTKRVRRVFTWSQFQLREAIKLCRPNIVYLTFCDYVDPAPIKGGALGRYFEQIREAARLIGIDEPEIIWQNGPTTDDARAL